MNRVVLAGLGVLLTTTLAGCGGQLTQTVQPTSQPVDSILKNMTVSPQTYFKTTHQVAFYLPLKDSANNPVADAYVVVYEENNADMPLFKGMTDSNGEVSGNMLLLTGTHTLVVEVDATGYNKISTKVTVQSTQDSLRITSLSVPSLKTSAVARPTDTDADGVPDSYDDYPTDPTLAFRINFPNFFMAYEDMYPEASPDWDVNDLVVKMIASAAMDKNNKVKKLFGSAELMARGADATYSSSFHLNLVLPFAKKGTATQALLNPNGVTVNTATVPFNDSMLDLTIFSNTGSLFATTNAYLIDTQLNKPYYKGSKTVFNIVFDTASFKLQDKTFPPFDPYLMVQNPKMGKTYDIHLPFSDPIPGSQDPVDYPYANFIDDNNFPYAMILPTNFAWPQETVKISTAYPDFINWISSGFADFTTWYNSPDTNKVYTKHLI